MRPKKSQPLADLFLRRGGKKSQANVFTRRASDATRGLYEATEAASLLSREMRQRKIGPHALLLLLVVTQKADFGCTMGSNDAINIILSFQQPVIGECKSICPDKMYPRNIVALLPLDAVRKKCTKRLLLLLLVGHTT